MSKGIDHKGIDHKGILHPKGILDPQGINLNPLTNEPYSETYKNLAKNWSKLPAYRDPIKIINIIKDNNVILIESVTGSGKTVLVPKYVLHAFDYNANIAITLPKQLVAKSAAEYAALTLDVQLGKQVGYQFRGESDFSKAGLGLTKLLYATDGTIKSRLLNDPLLLEFNAVIIDEAHERKIQIDFLLYLLKNVLDNRPDFKLIIMSATVNAAIFENYFKKYKFKKLMLEGEKGNYKIESKFLYKDLQYNDVLNEGYLIVKNILEQDLKGDILFFVTSQNETTDLCEKFSKLIKNKSYCIRLYSNVNKTEKDLAQDKDLYKESGKYDRKLIIATNVAESSLTIDNITFVIDSGYEFTNVWDPKIRAKKLFRQYITKAQVKQRMGRTGRTNDGICYHLYTEKAFNSFRLYPDPDIRTSDLTEDSLKLLATLGSVKELKNTFNKFIEPPLPMYVDDAILKLEELGLVKNKITELGITISSLNIDIQFGIALFYSAHYNCANEIMKLVCIFEIIKNNLSEIFIKNENAAKKINLIKKKFAHKTGDHISLIKLLDEYVENRDSDWCYKNYIKKDTMIKIFDLYKKRKGLRYKITRNNDLILFNEEILNMSLEKRVIYCLQKGLSVATRKNNNYSTTRSNNVMIDNNSFYLFSKSSKKIIYNELFVSDKAALNIVTKYSNKLNKL